MIIMFKRGRRAERKKGIALKKLDPPGTFSLHEVSLPDTLRMACQLLCAPREVVIIGVVPKEVAFGLDLTPDLQAALPRVIHTVLAELT